MRLTLRRFNDILTVMIVVLAAYIVLMPLLPAIGWWAKYEAPVISSKPNAKTFISDTKKSDNTLLIPTLGLRERIYEGPGEATLRYGVWKLPNKGTPDKGGNTVMAGHRFTYAGPAVFYHLDKVKVGDGISVYWSGDLHNYQVEQVKVVAPTDVSVQQNTKDSRLTIYTCTPLWSAKQRLVIIAKPKEAS